MMLLLVLSHWLIFAVFSFHLVVITSVQLAHKAINLFLSILLFGLFVLAS